ncbi:hypothetical protein [Extensimonas vulgaris]|uniref:Uncharacterized protein n=1 Tax=Extensimonas vulgaris TaxID=1031594 RepID=A0A369AMT3_9BURK|nr:hypothetical protein [Extensimonas vulgaris]RCX10690.1 hypothetical protein DFR45_10291 [Extensimonas vulgaris]TWI41332.1 hypothetical protein IP95_00089 [Extensimonas vulgaris]TXD16801.1 hypothetical protein FUT63_02080 [Extensimonas vulgaris]
MAQVDLLFGPLPITGQPVDLIFGADDASTPATVIATLQGTLAQPELHGTLIGGPVVDASIIATLPQPTLSALLDVRQIYTAATAILMPQPALPADLQAAYLSNTARPTVAQAANPWQLADFAQAGTQGRMQSTVATTSGTSTLWQRAVQSAASSSPRTVNAVRTPAAIGAAYSNGVPYATQAVALYQDATRDVRNLLRTAFANAERAQTPLLSQRHQDAMRDRRAWLRTGWQVARPQPPIGSTSGQGPAQWLIVGFGGRHQNAMRPPAGMYVRPPPPAPPPCYLPTLPAHLLFAGLAASSLPAHLVFVCERHTGTEPPGPGPGEPIVIPTLRVYIVSNDIILRRASDNAEVPCIGMSLALDSSSWTWGFDATLPAAALDMVQPDSSSPVELQALVNGTTFTVLAERVSRERVFGKAALRVSGRGRNAELDAPYAPTQVFGNAADRTHQQLFADVLTVNGVPMGYAIDYRLQDWLVPAGVWSVQGTYIDALSSLAQAAGAYLRPHTSDLAFAVMPLYPAWPPDSATPDIILPPDVLTRESVAWIDRPAYNRVFVRGQNQGVLAQVTRAGTAGDVLAPMVTDALITDIAAARQRAISIFGATGRSLDVSLSLPVLPATGVIQPGTCVQYADGATTRKGLVRSVSVQVSGQVSVLQTIGVEVNA